LIVLLEDDIFASPHTRLDLLTVLQLGFEGWHRVQIDPPYEPAANRSINQWLQRLDERTGEEVELALEIGMEQAVFGLPSDLSIRIGDVRAAEWTANPPRLPLAEALRLLRKPLRLLVENRHNDGAFLRAVAPSPWRGRLRDALDRGQIEIEHGGGSDMKTRLERASLEEALRLWALFDSDAREPGHPSAASEALRLICCHKGIPHRQLSRRAIENYLPVKALQGWAHSSFGNLRTSRRRKADAFAGMRPDQRHHYNMKHGFQGDRKDGIPSFYEAFADHSDLQGGFGQDIASLYHQEQLLIREEWLAQDGQQKETLDMVQSILRRL
jgi:hypothetical protein